MFKKIVSLCIAPLLYASIHITSFQSDFIQKITNDQNKTILYQGKVFFKAPHQTLWQYTHPIKKTVLIDGAKMILVEPELEQVTVSDFEKKQDLISLLKKAREIGKKRFVVNVNNKRFYIITNSNGVIQKIQYKDDLANKVVIEFINPRQNIEINESIFQIEVPAEYDRIYR